MSPPLFVGVLLLGKRVIPLHHASQDAIREAVLGQPEGEKRLKLMRVFKFVYGVDV